MSQFKSFLAEELEEYISYRRNIGYKKNNTRSFLLRFDRYIHGQQAGMDDLDPGFFLEFRQSIKREPGTVNKILTAIRGFMDYLVRKEYLSDNPLQDIPAMTEKAFIPFVFSSEDVESLLAVIRNRIRKSEEFFFKDLAVYTTVLLLARCGLRISEPMGLRSEHYRKDDKTLYIEKTKFHKDRLIPVPGNAADQLENYISVRNAFAGENKNPWLVPGTGQNKLSTYHIYNAFGQAVKDVGLEQDKQEIAGTVFGGPTPHSFRHSFAVNTLKSVKQRGICPHNALPVLAAYMGHTDYRYTMLCLKVIDADRRKAPVDFCIARMDNL